MNARLAIKVRAIPATRESIRAGHLWRNHELVSDGDCVRVAPVVYCDRSLNGWRLKLRRLLSGRND